MGCAPVHHGDCSSRVMLGAVDPAGVARVLVDRNRSSTWLFMRPSNRGLGDRFGQLIQFATIAKVSAVNVVTAWVSDDVTWSLQLPSDINKYVRFPPELRVVSTRRLARLRQRYPAFRNTGYGYSEGYDQLPETSYRMLHTSGVIHSRVSRNSYLKAHAEACAQTRLIVERLRLPMEYYALHLRRGDRTSGNAHDMLRAMHYIHAHGLAFSHAWVVVSDTHSVIATACKRIKCVKHLPVVTTREIVLRDFFMLASSMRIVQSVQQTHENGGWSSYSYMASSIGDVDLVACVPPRTRVARIKRECNCTLSHFVPCQ